MATTWAALMSGLNTSVIAAFGRDVTYTPLVAGVPGTPLAVKAVVSTQTPEDRTDSTYKVLFLRAADLAAAPTAPAQGDSVLIDAVSYLVFQVERDDEGGVALGVRQ